MESAYFCARRRRWYLGHTAVHLRLLFRLAEVPECVLQFDEIDALSKGPSRSIDVGELDRNVIALVQKLELSALEGAAVESNPEGNLDLSFSRRYDLAVSAQSRNRLGFVKFAETNCADFAVALHQLVLNRVPRLKIYA